MAGDAQAPRPETARARLAAHLRLARLPLAGTTVADVWAGAFGAHAVLAGAAGAAGAATGAAPEAGGGGAAASGLASALLHLLPLHAAALCLYAGGMTLNDVFDRERDRESAPARPIPSGAVSARAAALQGGLLLAGGVALAALSGARSAAIACALALAALAYDAALKRWALPGALAMGACRYLDVQLGAGFAAGPWLAPAVAVGGYTVLVTLISTCEEDPAAPARRRLLAGLVVAAVAYVIAVGYTYPHRWLGLPFFGLLAGLVAALGRGAVREPDPARVRALVLALLLGLFLLQGGALAGLGRPGLGVATAALAGSFVVIGRLVAGAAPAPAAAAPSPRRGDTSP